METNKNPALVAAGVFGFTGVALGAFGAHALASSLSTQAQGWWQTGTEYHLIHAVTLAAVSLGLRPSRCRSTAVVAWSLGIVLFSGSLYLLATTGVRAWGWATPFGGVSFLVGWGALAWAGGRHTPLYRTPSDR